VTILIRLLLVRLPPSSLPFNSLPAPLKALARGFSVLFHTSIWSSSTVYHHLNLLIHLPLPLLPPHPYTVPILQSSLLLLIFKLKFKGVSQCIPAVGVLCFGSFNPFHCSPFPFYLPSTPIFPQLSIHILISSTFSDVMFYGITDALSFSFPFPLSPSSIE
jgi:hypothetical protein